MKRILCVLLSLIMVIGIMSGFEITAFASTGSGTLTGGIKWELDSDGTLTISYSGDGTCDMPDAGSKDLTEWRKSTYRTSITNVVIGDNITSIGAYAFNSCDEIQQITFNTQITSIGDGAFYNCSSLESLVIPDSCESLGEKTFVNCSSLTYLELGANVSSLPSSTPFTNCSSLSTVLYMNANNASVLSSYSLSEELVYGKTYDCAANDGDTLTAIWDTDTKTLSFSGNGTMITCEKNGYPWSGLKGNCVYIDIDNDNIDGYITISDYAFCDFSNSNWQLNVSKYVLSIGDYAFFNTNFNYNTIYNSDTTIGDNAFGNGTRSFYARFFSNGGEQSQIYDKVLDLRENQYYDWHYYCIDDNHTYGTVTYAPTCDEKGYDSYRCLYCDADSVSSNYTDALGHTFVCTYQGDDNFVYTCTRCNKTTLNLSPIELVQRYNSLVGYDDNALSITVDIDESEYQSLQDAISLIDVENKETVVDTSTTYQTIDGFGASACWWSREAGNWDNIDDIMSLLYSSEDGIGLNIYRYNLGTGSASDYDTATYGTRQDTESFIDENGNYDFTKDASAQAVLASAQKVSGGDLRVTLFSNSPPVYYTTNHHAFGSIYVDSNGEIATTSSSNYVLGQYGACYLLRNLTQSYYDDYADYVVKCAEYFISEGYNVTEVSPINEPEYNWSSTTDSTSQEGCHWSYQDALTFYNNYMIPALMNSTQCNGTVGLSVWESGCLYGEDSGNTELNWENYFNAFFSSDSEYSSKNANIRSYVDSFDTHSYWAGTESREKYAQLVSSSDDYSSVQKVRCSEYCQMYNDGSSGVRGLIEKVGSTNGMTIEFGLALADIMYQDLTILNASEWDWWTACSGGIYPDGLVYIDYDNNDNIQTSKRLWCMGNYSKFIDEGAVRVDVSTGSALGSNLTTNETYSWEEWGTTYTDKNNYIEESAYLNPNGDIVIVYINNSDTYEYTVFNDNDYTCFSSYVTDETRDLELLQVGQKGDTVCIPAKSVTTVVLASDHNYETVGDVVEATCTEDGSQNLLCTNCGATVENSVIPATGHTESEAVVENEVAPTCTEEGSYENVVYCTVCNEELSRETVVVSATGHTKGETVVENKVASTCTKEGSYENVVYCTVCNEELSRETVVVPKIAHTYTSKVTTAATCSKEGVRTYTCTCGDTYTKSIAALGHNYTTVVTKAKTSEDGKIVKSCTRSGCSAKTTTTIYKIKSVTLSKTKYTYNGKVKKPTVTVKDSNGNKLTLNKDYTVTYSNSKSKSVGKYTVTVKFKGNYSGKEPLSYTIKPKSTSIKKVTAKAKGFKVTWKKVTKQTTGYQVQYATNKKFTKNKKTVTVKKNTTTSKTIKSLKAKKKYYVRVRTYKTVSGKKYYSSWSKTKTVTTKK